MRISVIIIFKYHYTVRSLLNMYAKNHDKIFCHEKFLGVHIHLSKWWRVHAYLLKCWRGRLHGWRKVGNPCFRSM